MKKAILLFEVMLVAAIISIASLFLFGAYSTFIRASKKSAKYLELVQNSQEKIFELYLDQAEGMDFLSGSETEGSLASGSAWSLGLEDLSLPEDAESIIDTAVVKAVLTLKDKSQKQSFDAIIYLTSEQSSGSGGEIPQAQ